MSLTRREFLHGALAAGALGSVPGCRDAGGDPETIARRTYDLCVIGSGFAGLPLALHASRNGLDTLVVEAGVDPTAPFPGKGLAEEFRYTNSGEIDYAVAASRVIAVGGASNHWEGMVSRLRPSDLSVYSLFGLDADWPLRYEELDPLYCRAEQFLAVEGYPPVPGAEPPRSCAYPSAPSSGYRPPQLDVDGRRLRYFGLARSRRSGGPVRLAGVEAAAFAASAHGTLLGGHRAARLVTLDGRSIDHAELRDAAGTTRRVRARVFVVAAGVIESPRLLLLSRSDWFPHGLGNRRDLVGRYFVEHPTYRWLVHPKTLTSLYRDEIHRGPNRTYDYADALRRDRLNASHFQLRVDGEDVVLKLQPELEPRPENRVTLSRSERDRFGDALPDLHFGFSERDLRTLERGRRLLRQQVRALGVDPDTAERSLKWRWHPSGTLRLARVEADGVVDSDLRVFGTDNLYVSGAAIFPTSGTAHPTLTVVALGLRLADHLVARLGGASAG